MSEMSICLCFSYFTPAYYLSALFLVPEQAATLLMHQNPGGRKDDDCPKEGTVQGSKQLVDTALTAEGKGRAIVASSNDLSLFVVTEELKKGLGWVNEILGSFCRWCLWSVKVSMGEKCLHRYQGAHGTEGKGARRQSWPLLQNKKPRFREMLSAPGSQMDLNRAGVLEKRCCIGCISQPWRCLAQGWHLQRLWRSVLSLRAQHRGQGPEVLTTPRAECDAVQRDALNARRNPSWLTAVALTELPLRVAKAEMLAAAHLVSVSITRGNAGTQPSSWNLISSHIFSSLPIPQSFSQHPAVATQREDYEFKCREKNSNSRSGWTSWRKKMLFFMQMLLVMKSEGKGKTEHTSCRGEIVSK